MKRSTLPTLCLLFVAAWITSCSSPAQAPPTAVPPTKAPTKLTVTQDALVGVWAKVLTGKKEFPFYWLKFTPEGTFAVTTNKEQFDTRVNQLGVFAVDGDQVTLSAQPGSVECEGVSATFRVALYEDGTLEFEDIDVPCEGWLNMSAGRLGESEIWIRLAD